MMLKHSIFVLFFLGLAFSDPITATVYLKNGAYEVKTGVYDLKSGIVAGKYQDGFEEIGWDYLDVESTSSVSSYNDTEIEFASGVLEGFLTQKRIWNVYQNAEPFMLKHFNFTIPESVKDFLKEQREYVMAKDSSDPFWDMAKTTFSHLDGLTFGYNLGTEHPLNYFEMYSIFSWGDILSLLGVIPSSPFPPGIYDDRCTGAIRYSKEDNDIYFSHTSWFMYPFAIKMFKSYTMHFNNPLVETVSTYFSSYPATPTSSDDFYVTSSDLFILETTLSCYNTSMAKMLTPKSLLYWQRILIANRFAKTATEWTTVFSKQNGGTYNDEFIILDVQLAKQGLEKQGEFPKQTLVILNQIPGYIDTYDITSDMLSMGYFPSYNIPYSKVVYDRCDIEQYIQKNPNEVHMLDYNKCCRALMFKRDAPKINNITDFKKFMRYNDYKNDPLSMGYSTYAISARFDLEEENPACGGGYDSKVVSVKNWLARKEIEIVSGPTYDQVPVFEYSKSKVCAGVIHDGQPDMLKFDWQKVNY